jgi:hypothetical protein
LRGKYSFAGREVISRECKAICEGMPYRSHDDLYRGTPDEGSPAEKMSLGTFFPTPSCVFERLESFALCGERVRALP